MEPKNQLSRRRLLGATGGALAGIAGTGLTTATNAGTKHVEVNVGYTAASDHRAVRHAATTVHRQFAFNAVTVTLPQQAVARLRNRTGIRYVEPNDTMHALHHDDWHDGGPPGDGDDDTSQTLPWGIDRVDADVAHANGETGTSADIAIIDTGIDDDHPDLQANVGAGKAFVRCRGRNCNYPWSDDHDHGTHCAGIADAVDNSEGVIGVSTDATLHAVKVLDRSGSGTYSDVAAGIEYTADQGWDVGSLSLGGGPSQVVKDACVYAYDKGVLLVAAAGNDGPCTDCVTYPAAYEECIAVSATSCDDSLAGFSSTGPEVELAAPGEAVYSTIIGDYDTFSGTSMACPHVSGAGGQLMANGYLNTQARDQLNSTAEDIGLSSNEQGNGLVDVAAALGLDSSENGTGNSPNC